MLLVTCSSSSNGSLWLLHLLVLLYPWIFNTGLLSKYVEDGCCLMHFRLSLPELQLSVRLDILLQCFLWIPSIFEFYLNPIQLWRLRRGNSLDMRLMNCNIHDFLHSFDWLGWWDCYRFLFASILKLVFSISYNESYCGNGPTVSQFWYVADLNLHF